jgi:group I intron endonuclease
MAKEMGVYVITNLVNKKIYIGSTNDFKHREYKHFKDLADHVHPNRWLQMSYDKYGPQAFLFSQLEIVTDINQLIPREQFYLDKLKPWRPHKGYNICKIAGGTDGITYTEESRAKIAKIKRGLPATGKNQKGPGHSRAKEFTLKSPTGEIVTAKNIDDFARQHGLDPEHIRAVLRGDSHTHAGWSLPDYVAPEVKTYKFKDPDGNIQEVTGNLKAWCREKNLRYNAIQGLIYKTRLSHQGWTLADTTKIKEAYYKIQGPDGTIYETNNLKMFCLEHDLSDGAMSRVANKKAKQHKGFKVLEAIIPERRRLFTLLGPDGKSHSAPSIGELCEKYNLEPGPISHIFKHNQQQWNGWRLPDEEDKREKTYTLVSPEGKEYTFIGLKEFCEEHNLNPGGVYQVLQGISQHHHGWTKPGSSFIPHENITYRFISPDGIVHETNKLRAWCREKGLNKGTMYQVWTGKCKSCRGWRKA